MSKYLINTDEDLSNSHAELVKFILSHSENPRLWPLEQKDQVRLIVELVEWAKRIHDSEPFKRAEVVRAAAALEKSTKRKSATVSLDDLKKFCHSPSIP